MKNSDDEIFTEWLRAFPKRKKYPSEQRGQFGVCYLHVEPLPRGGGFEFVNKIVGGAIPRLWIPSVEKGVVQRMTRALSLAIISSTFA